jgi:4-amino-4-deoxy-L-arabinose transferase-like glycosyltransferase
LAAVVAGLNSMNLSGRLSMKEQETSLADQHSKHLADSTMMFVFAWMVRSLHNWWFASAPFYPYLIGDAKRYDLWAREIAGGNWLGTEVFYQAPLYPYFLAVIHTLIGNSLSSVRMVQTFLGAVACVFLMNATTNLFNRRAGIVAGVIMSLYAPSIFLETLIQKSVLDLFFVSVMIWLCSKTITSNGRKWWVWIGATLGLLCLTRENALILIPVVLLWAVFRKPVDDGRFRPVIGRMALCCGFGLGLVMTLSPVAIRNYHVGGEFHLTTSQLGPNFYIGNNPNADGTYVPLKPGRGDAIYEQRDAIDVAETALGRSLTPAEVSAYFLAQSLDYIKSDPLDWLKLIGTKALLTINATELVDTEDQYTHAMWSPPLRIASLVFHFGTLLPLGIVGIWLTRRKWRELWWAYLMIGAFTASVIGFFVFGRYRFPLVPLMLIFAAPGIVLIYDGWQEKKLASLTMVGPWLIGLFVVCNLPLVDTTVARSITFSNFGVEALIRDDVKLSEEFFQQALELKPDNAVAHSNLAVLYWRKYARTDMAEAHFNKALEYCPEFDSARERLAAMKQELAGLPPSGAESHPDN